MAPTPHAVAAQVDRFLDRMPPPARGALRAGFISLAAYTRVTTGRPLVHLDADQREAVLTRLARRAATRDALEGLKAVVLLVAGAEQARPDLAARVASTGVARPDGELDVTPAQAWASWHRCDAVVIGSGAGGAMVARTLARAGLATVVVEEGRRFGVAEFREDHPLDRFASLYRDAGATAAFGRPPIVVPIGRGVGGTTLVNSGTCYRTPTDVLVAWRDRAGLGFADPETFGPYLDEVEATLQVAPVPGEVMGRNGELLLAGAAALGWRSGPLRRNAPGCGGCCQCAIGCPRNAKLGVHLNALPEACAAGARVLSEARVERVLHEHGRAVGVMARRHDGSRVELRAPRVVVAAGATETPPLLRRSGLGQHPGMGRHLSLHPAVSAAGRFGEEVVAWEGVLQSAAVEEFHASHGILVEATSTPPGMGSMILPGRGRRLLDELAQARHLATLGAMIADEPSGRVLGRRRSVLYYGLTRGDGDRLRHALRIMGQVLFAAGAIEVLAGLPDGTPARNLAELDDALARLDPRRLHVAAFHPSGSVGAGADSQRYPVGPDGRLRGVEGVWVADASVLPTCPGVNPQLSVMASALAIAEEILSPRSGPDEQTDRRWR